AARPLPGPAGARDDGRAPRGGAFHGGGPRAGRGAARAVRRRASPRRPAARDAGPRRLPLRVVRGLALGLARAADPARVGELRAVPRGVAGPAGLAAGPPPGDRPGAPRGVRRAERRAGRGCAVPASRAVRRLLLPRARRPRHLPGLDDSVPEQRGEAVDRLLRERRLEQLLRDERAGARAETRSRMRRGADVPEPLARSAVRRRLCEGAPGGGLVEAERASGPAAVPQGPARRP